MNYKVVATVVKLLEGAKCPNGYQVGDTIEVSRGKVTGIKCPSSFNSIYPTIFAMRLGAASSLVGHLKDKETFLEQCPDPKRCVTFEIKRTGVDE